MGETTGLMKNKITYLAGKVSSKKWNIVKDIPDVKFISSDGSNHSEHDWGHALPAFNDDYYQECVKEYVCKKIDKSDMLLAYLHTPNSFRSIAEILYASTKNIPTNVIIQVPCDVRNGYECPEYMDMFDAYYFATAFPGIYTFVVRSDEEASSVAANIVGLESPMETLYYESLNASFPDVAKNIVTQHKVIGYRLDFAFPDVKLGVEIDGKEYHHTKQQLANDKKRQNHLKQAGWDIIRFTGSQVFNRAHKCASETDTVYRFM